LKDNQKIYDVYVENQLSYKIVQEINVSPKVSELARSDKIAQTVQDKDIVLTSTSGLQMIVTQDKLLITESTKLSDQDQTSGLCSINVRELSRSVPRDVLRAVLYQQKSKQLGPQNEEQIRKINNLMNVLNQRVFPFENQIPQRLSPSNAKTCIYTISQDNEELTLKPLNTETIFTKSAADLRAQFPDYCIMLKTDLISLLAKLTPQQREVKLSIENNNDVVKLVQVRGQPLKLFVNDEERDSFQYDDLTIQKSSDGKYSIVCNKFEVVFGDREDKSGYVRIKVLSPLGAWNSLCQKPAQQLAQISQTDF